MKEDLNGENQHYQATDSMNFLNVSSSTEIVKRDTDIQKWNFNQTFNLENPGNRHSCNTTRFEEQCLDWNGELHETPPQTNLEVKEPRPFLRRGAGLARFNLPTDPNKQPSRVKRKQPKVVNVKSKFNEETEAFKNKKTTPRKTPIPPHQSITKSPEIPRPKSVSKTKKDVFSSKGLPIKEPEPSLKLIWNNMKGAKEKTSNSRSPLEPIRQSSICDSVEHSFREKLSVQEKRQVKELKELEVFEILEDATLDSSFNR